MFINSMTKIRQWQAWFWDEWIFEIIGTACLFENEKGYSLQEWERKFQTESSLSRLEWVGFINVWCCGFVARSKFWCWFHKRKQDNQFCEQSTFRRSLVIGRSLKKQDVNFCTEIKSRTLRADGDDKVTESVTDKGTVISVDGHQYSVDVLYLGKPTANYIRCVVETVLKICRDGKGGDILCFLPTGEDIDQAIWMAEDNSDAIIGLLKKIRCKCH